MKINLIVVCIATFLQCAEMIIFESNFNKDRIKQAYIDDSVSLPIIVNSPLERQYCQATATNFNMKKHELRDSDYVPNIDKLGEVQQKIVFQEEPPQEVFDVSRINIEDYQVLQIRDFKIMLINPTKNFRFCITEVFSDSQTIKRTQHKKFPFCLNSHHKYPFFFQFYITDFKPQLFYKVVIYFFIDIYDKNTFIGNKIWPREIFVKVNQNFLKLAPLEAKNCGKNFTTLTISNHQSYHIKIAINSEEQSIDKGMMREVMVPSQKSFKMTIMPQQKIMTVTSRAFELSDIRLPKLFMPIICLEPLDIDHFNIGVLNSERSISQMPLLVSSYSKDIIQIVSIAVESNSGSVNVLPVEGNALIEPGQSHKIVGKIILYLNVEPIGKGSISVRINYIQRSNPKEILQVKNIFKYHEFRNPFTFGTKRYINIKQIANNKKKSQSEDNKLLNNLFTMRNNLNLPIQLTNVIYDSDIFKVTWLAELKEFIYPNQQRDQILLEYVGPLEISISPLKFILTLQFNGKLYMPIQIVVYDETLQCVYNNIQQKCQNLPPLDYGYFRNNSPKFKQIVVRNWNPIPLELQLNLPDKVIVNYGMNFTISIFGPFPKYEIVGKHNDSTVFYYLKGGHFIIINFAITPKENATSGESIFQISTEHEQINTKLKFKIENATIALIPQVLWINSAYEKSVEYLNLVSTFSEPYKIKSVSVNISNINIFSNNDTEIYENQWIGLALIYHPFGKGNFTDSCCGSQFAMNSFINSLYLTEFKKLTYATVRIVTTTQLQTNSTVIIDNTPPKLIKPPNITLRLINTKNTEPVFINFKNIFSQPMKFSIVLTPTYLYRDARQYMTTMRRVRKNFEDTMLCVNNGITVTHNFSPQMVKNLFNLDSIPQEVTIQPLGNSEYYVGSERKSSLGTSNQLSKYVIETVDEGARICYRMNTSRYIKELIETKILNDLAENHSNELFLQFVEKQMQYFNMPFQFLEHDQFYDSLSISDYQKYCVGTIFPLFRFCKQINLQITPFQNSQIILNPKQSFNITIEKILLPNRQISGQSQFYLTILNNITKYQSHFMQVSISEPKIAIQRVCKSKANDTCLNQKQIAEVLNNKDGQLAKLVYKANSKYQIEAKQALNRIKVSTIPINILQSQFQNNTYRSQQYFTIKNNGVVDIQITHIGLDKNQFICEDELLVLNNNQCNFSFTLSPNEQKNISYELRIEENLEKFSQFHLSNVYLYYQDKYYYQVHLIMKFPEINVDYASNRKAIYSLFLNIISMFFIILVIILKRKENIEHQKKNDKKTKTKILNTDLYSHLGHTIQKKKRKLNLFIDQHILALKEHQEKKLKDFFNSSGESQIERKNMEQESSNNNLLNALRQPERNSMIMSEESSIDMNDLNHMNKSSDNVADLAQKVATQQESESEEEQDSLFEEGDQVPEEKMVEDYGWGKQENSKKESEKDESYYNVFLSQNPLKKEQKDPFHWMQRNQSNRQW